MAELIRWHGPQSGGHYSGHAGANDAMLFNIWAPSGTAGDEEWVLTSSLPGQHPGKARSYGTDPDELKPRAEELLREFASSIGAVFPAAPELLRFDGTRCDWEVKALDGEYGQCPAKSRYRVERSDHDPGVSRPPEYGPAEACEAHLADSVCALVDGDERLTATVKVRWT